MRRGILALLALALVIGAGAAFVALRQEAPRREASLLDQPVFPGLADRLAAAATVELRRHDGAVTLRREGDTWVVAEKHGFPAVPGRVRELFVGLAELRLVEERTANPELFSRLGLEDPDTPGGTSVLVTVKDQGGRELAALIVGRRRVRTAANLPEAVHVRRPGESRAWLAEGTLRPDTDPLLWLERDLLDIRRDRVARVTTERAGAAPLTLHRAAPGEEFTLADRPEGFSADRIRLDDLPRALEFLSFTDVMPAAALAEAAPAGAATVATFDGLTVSLRLVTHGEQRWATIDLSWFPPDPPLAEDAPDTLLRPEAAKAEAEAAAVRVRGWAFRLPDWKADVLTYRLEDVAAREENPS